VTGLYPVEVFRNVSYDRHAKEFEGRCECDAPSFVIQICQLIESPMPFVIFCLQVRARAEYNPPV